MLFMNHFFDLKSDVPKINTKYVPKQLSLMVVGHQITVLYSISMEVIERKLEL